MGVHKKTITDLPNELLEHIFAVICDPSDVFALTYSTSRFWRLADPDKYHSVLMKNHAEIVEFQDAIKRKPQRAAVVRSLIIDRSEDSSSCADNGTIKHDLNTTISYPELCKLVNLTTYRIPYAEHLHAFEMALSDASHGLCLNRLKTCKSLELTSLKLSRFHTEKPTSY